MAMYRRYPRRRTPARRRRYTRGMKTSSRGSKSSAQLAVYANPFSTSTTNPKIPDGKAYHSSGLRLQAVREYTVGAGNTYHLLLFPGLNNGLIAAGILDSSNRYMPYTSHGVHAGPPNDTLQQSGSQIAKWRLVSQAMKITLTNNSDENDGWWEAIRVQTSNSSNFVGVTDPSDASVVIIGDGEPVGDLPGLNVQRQLVENPTYVTGKLRDIHKHLFQLMPQGGDHDFNTMPGGADYTNSDTAVKFLTDTNFDAVYVRIHGRGGGSPTRIMTHVVSNQEVIFDEGATLSRFHSESDANPAQFERSKRAIILASPKATKRGKYSSS